MKPLCDPTLHECELKLNRDIVIILTHCVPYLTRWRVVGALHPDVDLPS